MDHLEVTSNYHIISSLGDKFTGVYFTGDSQIALSTQWIFTNCETPHLDGRIEKLPYRMQLIYPECDLINVYTKWQNWACRPTTAQVDQKKKKRLELLVLKLNSKHPKYLVSEFIFIKPQVNRACMLVFSDTLFHTYPYLYCIWQLQCFTVSK